MILWNSHTEPGHPCEMRSGIGRGPIPGSWMKCRSMSRIGTVKWRNWLSLFSCVRQSYFSRQ